MLIVAIVLALIIIYLMWKPTPTVKVNNRPQRRTGSVYAYNDMSDLSHDQLRDNTVTGAGGGSMVKNFVSM